jgi:hypothetical protein
MYDHSKEDIISSLLGFIDEPKKGLEPLSYRYEW